MHVRNKTNYLTRDLAAIIRRVAQDEFDAAHIRWIVVDVRYRRANSHTNGYAIYGTGEAPAGWVELRLEREPASIDKIKLAHTVAHEFAHNKGLRHHEMISPRYGFVDGWRDLYAWAAEMPLRLKPEKAEPGPEAKIEKALLHAKDKVVCVQRRQKRLNTVLRRWTRRARYYERRLAALKSRPAKPPSNSAPGEALTP
jgi:hypothetical protein